MPISFDSLYSSGYCRRLAVALAVRVRIWSRPGAPERSNVFEVQPYECFRLLKRMFVCVNARVPLRMDACCLFNCESL